MNEAEMMDEVLKLMRHSMINYVDDYKSATQEERKEMYHVASNFHINMFVNVCLQSIKVDHVYDDVSEIFNSQLRDLKITINNIKEKGEL